jgi:hypothetical protein
MKPLMAAFAESCTLCEISNKGLHGEFYQGTKTGNCS